jgi:hypothetical protein
VNADARRQNFREREEEMAVPSRTMAQPRTKGLQFRSFARSLRRLRGEEALAKTIELLPGELGDGLRYATIVTGGWYPLEWYRDLHGAAQRATGEGRELAREIAKAGVQDDFRGVYRLVTLALSPQAMFRWAPKVVTLYYDTGQLVIDVAEKGFVKGRFLGFAGFDRNLWEDMIGGVGGVMELAGAKNLAPRITGGGKEGDEDMALEVRWI